MKSNQLKAKIGKTYYFSEPKAARLLIKLARIRTDDEMVVAFTEKMLRHVYESIIRDELNGLPVFDQESGQIIGIHFDNSEDEIIFLMQLE